MHYHGTPSHQILTTCYDHKRVLDKSPNCSHTMTRYRAIKDPLYLGDVLGYDIKQ